MTRPPMRPAMVAVVLVTACLLAACGSHPARSADPTTAAANPADPTLLVEDEPGYGPLVTDPEGSPLYAWTGAGHGGVCGRSCPAVWVPLEVPDGATASAGEGIRPELIGTIAARGGGRQITYHGHPVYTYLGDTTTFEVKGNAQRVDGGTFRAMKPSGVLAPLH